MEEIHHPQHSEVLCQERRLILQNQIVMVILNLLLGSVLILLLLKEKVWQVEEELTLHLLHPLLVMAQIRHIQSHRIQNLFQIELRIEQWLSSLQ